MAKFKGSINLSGAASSLAAAGNTQARGLAALQAGMDALGRGIGGGLASIGQQQARKKEIAQQRSDRAAELGARRDERERDRRITLQTMMYREDARELDQVTGQLASLREMGGVGLDDPAVAAQVEKQGTTLLQKQQELQKRLSVSRQRLLGEIATPGSPARPDEACSGNT